MLFCEKCNLATSENCCPVCGNKKLRTVQDEDFCFFVNLDEFYFTMLEKVLKDEAVDVVGVPYYTHGVTYATAGRASGRKVYIRYKDIEQATEIYETLFSSDDEN